MAKQGSTTSIAGGGYDGCDGCVDMVYMYTHTYVYIYMCVCVCIIYIQYKVYYNLEWYYSMSNNVTLF